MNEFDEYGEGIWIFVEESWTHIEKHDIKPIQ